MAREKRLHRRFELFYNLAEGGYRCILVMVGANWVLVLVRLVVVLHLKVVEVVRSGRKGRTKRIDLLPVIVFLVEGGV